MSRPPFPPRNFERVSAPVRSRFQQNSDSSTTSLPRPSNLGRASVGANVHSERPSLVRSSLQKTRLELESRSEFHGTVDLSVQILDAESGRPVMFKFDGTRFEQSDATIKVASNVTYNINVALKPLLRIEDGLLHLQAVLPDGVIKQDIVELAYATSEERVLTGSWQCKLPPCKKNTRVMISISGVIEEFGEFEVPIMFKVYGPQDGHRNAGYPLKQIATSLKRLADDATSKVKRMSIRFMN